MGDAVVEIFLRVPGSVWTAGVDIERVVERRHASLPWLRGVERHASATRNPIRAGVRAEIVVE